MKLPLISLAAVLALTTVTGCSKEADAPATADDATVAADDTMNTDMAADAATDASAAVPAPQQFANMAAASDAFEIQSSQMALKKSQSADTKKFAQQMIDAHTQSTAKLKAITGMMSPAMTPDPMLSADQKSKLDALTAASGADFDKLYMEHQVASHQMALSMMQNYASNGGDAKLKQFASEMTPIVSGHLDMARNMKMPV